MGDKSNAPVIVKRKKVVGGDVHHGGAWKVAYADFVTAMMAFFLLMWLLNATTEQQRKGIADYFSPTVPVNRVSGGGADMFGGDSIMTDRTLARNGTGQAVGLRVQGQQSAAEAAAEVAALREVEQQLMGVGGESLLEMEALRHVVTRVTDEGLIVEIFARDGAPIFVDNTREPTPVMVELMTHFAPIFGMVTNPIAIDGHLRTQPVVLAENPVWDISSGRADAVRELLVNAGVEEVRMARITGHADRRPVTTDRFATRNDRVKITLLRWR